jgi:hypothetical protein
MGLVLLSQFLQCVDLFIQPCYIVDGCEETRLWYLTLVIIMHGENRRRQRFFAPGASSPWNYVDLSILIKEREVDLDLFFFHSRKGFNGLFALQLY